MTHLKFYNLTSLYFCRSQDNPHSHQYILLTVPVRNCGNQLLVNFISTPACAYSEPYILSIQSLSGGGHHITLVLSSVHHNQCMPCPPWSSQNVEILVQERTRKRHATLPCLINAFETWDTSLNSAARCLFSKCLGSRSALSAF